MKIELMKRFAPLIAWGVMLGGAHGAEPVRDFGLSATNGPGLTMDSPARRIWEGGVGEGFAPGVRSLTFEVGGAIGLAVFGSRQAHDFVLGSVSHGWMLGQVRARDRWWRGNWEFRTELFGGMQVSPETTWVVGLTPHLRYNFATGSRVIPFVDAGAGVSATGIGAPDLSGTFEFNLQPAVGLHWFLRDNLVLTVEGRYLHLSCAKISSPNLGVNSIVGMAGLTWFF